MSGHFADDLLAAIESKKAPVCVGLDPVYDRLPPELRAKHGEDKTGAIDEFCRNVLEIISPVVPSIKIQSAYFEIYHEKGVEIYYRMARLARQLGMVVIGDVKRNDIGSTAKAYAQGHLGGQDTPQAVTVNGYLGADGIAPFLETGQKDGKGVFVLVRTSNPSAAAIQDFCNAGGKKLYQHMAELVAQMGSTEGMVGHSGYSRLGAVVGATWPTEARELRQIMPQQIFLVPGYGAQGATAKDCAASFKADGTGAIVNASRSVIFAYSKPEFSNTDWKKAIQISAQEFAKDIANAVF